MIIIEGSDLVGKTTLCGALVKRLRREGLIYSHFTRLPDEFNRYWGYIERMSSRIVQDRFHMSEPVYAKMRGDQTKLTHQMYRLIDAKTRLLGTVNVVVTAEDDLIKSRWREGEMYKIEQVYHANSLFKKCVMNEMDGYVMDVDIHIGCTVEKPYPDTLDIERIAALWMGRQMELHDVLRTRPAFL